MLSVLVLFCVLDGLYIRRNSARSGNRDEVENVIRWAKLAVIVFVALIKSRFGCGIRSKQIAFGIVLAADGRCGFVAQSYGEIHDQSQIIDQRVMNDKAKTKR